MTSVAGISSTGAITGSSLSVGSGAISGGAITGSSLSVGSGGVTSAFMNLTTANDGLCGFNFNPISGSRTNNPPCRIYVSHNGGFSSNFYLQIAPNGYNPYLALQTRLFINSEGNVGIGTESPAAKLDVNGSLNAGAITGSSLSVGSGAIGGGAITGSSLSLSIGSGAAYIRSITTNLSNSNAGVDSAFITLTGDGGNHNCGFYLNPFGLRNGGPSCKIFAKDNDFSSDFYLQIADRGNTGTSPLQTRLFISSATGNVGIGTESPAAKLDVNGSLNAGAITGSSLSLSISSGDNIRSITTNLSNSNDGVDSAFINLTGDGRSHNCGFNLNTYGPRTGGPSCKIFTKDNYFSSDFYLQIADRGNVGAGLLGNNPLQTRLFIGCETGNVGIGTESPAAKLDVSGSLRVNSTKTIRGIQFGTIPATGIFGASGPITFTFPTAFASIPVVTCTVNYTGENFPSVSAMITETTTTFFKYNVLTAANTHGERVCSVNWIAICG